MPWDVAIKRIALYESINKHKQERKFKFVLHKLNAQVWGAFISSAICHCYGCFQNDSFELSACYQLISMCRSVRTSNSYLRQGKPPSKMLLLISAAVKWSLSIAFSLMSAVHLLIVYITKFSSQPWKPKDRPNPPACLSDPKYGTHKFFQANVSISRHTHRPIHKTNSRNKSIWLKHPDSKVQTNGSRLINGNISHR